jgi:hypothetical protein
VKTMSLKLPEVLDEKLSALAGKRGAAKSAVVREALEDYLRSASPVRPESCLALASDLIGCVNGPVDLSFHTRHMKEFGK